MTAPESAAISTHRISADHTRLFCTEDGPASRITLNRSQVRNAPNGNWDGRRGLARDFWSNGPVAPNRPEPK